eukprot:GHVT01005658.1.p1 GENE.GHVT01005658.1~~GHVT01005658.1.p1  ORF type:complete len:291 (+),score=37.21 GHVT01005658.1:250-1122(+)
MANFSNTGPANGRPSSSSEKTKSNKIREVSRIQNSIRRRFTSKSSKRSTTSFSSWIPAVVVCGILVSASVAQLGYGPPTGSLHHTTGSFHPPTGSLDHPTASNDEPTGPFIRPIASVDHLTASIDEPTGPFIRPTGPLDHPTGSLDQVPSNRQTVVSPSASAAALAGFGGPQWFLAADHFEVKANPAIAEFGRTHGFRLLQECYSGPRGGRRLVLGSREFQIFTSYCKYVAIGMAVLAATLFVLVLQCCFLEELPKPKTDGTEELNSSANPLENSKTKADTLEEQFVIGS